MNQSKQKVEIQSQRLKTLKARSIDAQAEIEAIRKVVEGLSAGQEIGSVKASELAGVLVRVEAVIAAARLISQDALLLGVPVPVGRVVPEVDVLPGGDS